MWGWSWTARHALPGRFEWWISISILWISDEYPYGNKFPTKKNSVKVSGCKWNTPKVADDVYEASLLSVSHFFFLAYVKVWMSSWKKKHLPTMEMDSPGRWSRTIFYGQHARYTGLLASCTCWEPLTCALLCCRLLCWCMVSCTLQIRTVETTASAQEKIGCRAFHALKSGCQKRERERELNKIRHRLNALNVSLVTSQSVDHPHWLDGFCPSTMIWSLKTVIQLIHILRWRLLQGAFWVVLF